MMCRQWQRDMKDIRLDVVAVRAGALTSQDYDHDFIAGAKDVDMVPASLPQKQRP